MLESSSPLGKVPAPLFTPHFYADIESALSAAEKKIVARIQLPGAVGRSASLAELVEAIFSRIPRDLVAGRSSVQIVSLLRPILAVLADIGAAPDRLIVRLVQDGTGSALVTALDDSPFIVSSTAECLAAHSLSLPLFAHPIVLFDGKPVAVSYIELGRCTPEAGAVAVASLRDVLATLKHVVSDFSNMSSTVTQGALALSSGVAASDDGEIDLEELRSLLMWFLEGSFFFLATSRWDARTKLQQSHHRGAWNAQNEFIRQLHGEVREDVQHLLAQKQGFSIRKLRLKSPIHRRSSLLHILIEQPSSPAEYLSIVGYLTSKAWAAEAEDTPLLRRKMAQVLRAEGVLPNSYDFKYITDAVDNMPTDEALCCTTPQLREMVRIALGVFDGNTIRSYHFCDVMKRRATTVIVMPSDRFSSDLREDLRTLLEDTFGASRNSSGVHLDASKRRQHRVYVTIPVGAPEKCGTSHEDLLARITDVCLSWEDRLHKTLVNLGIPPLAGADYSEEYQVSHSAEEAADDLRAIRSLGTERPLLVSYRSGSAAYSEADTITVYTLDQPLTISRCLPILENVGYEVLGAHSYDVQVESKEIHLLELGVRPRDGSPHSSDIFDRTVAPGIALVMRGLADDDLLNILMRRSGLDVRAVALLRAYCRLLWQVTSFATRGAILQALALNPQCSHLLWQTFETRFDPSLGMQIGDRDTKSQTLASVFTETLRGVTDITQDRVLRAILSLLLNTVRTNFYQRSETIVLKLLSSRIDIMPEPRPLFELFVTSPRVEGTHLRSSPVARGGIRWSERPEDFRAEVLGLMKTQKVKNVIIVPSGAKGGFVVRNLPKEGDAIPAVVEGCYREYIRGLLSVADNRVEGSVRHPPGLVIHDGPDPYFVVAADKGTASFSDVANGIAENEFHFWLGDAFASGGSKGYDHKKYGITARGGWECVKRHFLDIGIDFDRPFTVAGIGDMSGDVFGNGLLLSRQMKLIGAFNHKHIFIDPDPDPAASFTERKRLFEKPRSQWSDYNPALISKGGGVFGRFDKEIRLSPEARAALGAGDDVPAAIDGEHLIRLVLRSPVDLLWNGGIGTYVKAAAESHSAVNDGTNDRVRIDATEVRARVIGEGGNLGFTQRARVEYSARGGRINTDAIDNSGGVDLSDHEVNLKLLFAPLVAKGDLHSADRNGLLREIDDDVVQLVLSHNRDQALMLSLSQERSKTNVEQYQSLIRDMNRLGYLSRVLDGLPDDEELGERSQNKVGLMRPELAICGAAAKMWVKESLRTSDLCDDPLLQPFLDGYFPPKVAQQFPRAIAEHPLRTDIIASELVNAIFPVIGIPFVHSMTGIHATTVPIVFKNILAADMIIGGPQIRRALRSFDSAGKSSVFSRLWLEMSKTVCDASSWLLGTHGAAATLAQLVDLYREDFLTLAKHGIEIMAGDERHRYERRVEEYRSLGLDDEGVRVFALYRRILPIFEVLWSARKFGHDVRAVGATFSKVTDKLGLNAVFRYEMSIDATNKWEQELVISSYQEIRRGISMITGALLGAGKKDDESIDSAVFTASGFEAIRTTTQEIAELGRQKKPLKVAALSVVARQLRLFSIR